MKKPKRTEFKSHYLVYGTGHPNNCICVLLKISEMNENSERN